MSLPVPRSSAPVAPTRAASGASTLPTPREAVEEAVALARAGLAGAEPRLALIFSSPKLPARAVLDAARRLLPGCEVALSQTAGELTERGLSRGGLALLLVAGGRMLVESRFAAGLEKAPAQVARALCAGFADQAERALAAGLPCSTTIALVDGLSGQGDRLVEELLKLTRRFQPVVGGAAGDDAAFKATSVGAQGGCGTDGAAAIHLFHQRPFGIGVAHGLRPRTPRMEVTRSSGNVIQEIDGKPAFEAYRSYAASRGITLEPARAGDFLIANELGVFFLDELHHARAPVGVGPAGELKLVAQVPVGASVCILDGEPPEMVAACRRAAEEARAGLGDTPCAGVLLFDCVCRGILLGDGFDSEIEAVRSVFPGTPIAGFLTYGEIARFRGRLDGWHNTTVVVVAIPAA